MADEYLCGECRAGLVRRYRVKRTGVPVWVCAECDSIWFHRDRLGRGESLGTPGVEMAQILAPSDGNLLQIVEPYVNAGDATDWEQIEPFPE